MEAVSTRGRLHAVWLLTWPQVAMLLCQFVIGITDVWASGRLGANVQATVGLVTQCQTVCMSLVVASSGAAVAAISQSFGAGRDLRARRYSTLMVYGCILLGLAVSVFASLGRGPLLRLVQTPADMMLVALPFWSIILWSLAGHYTLSIGAAVFRAKRSVQKPLLITLCACVCNVFGDLAFGLGWWGFPAYGAAGIAWSTFFSVWGAALLMLFLLAKNGLLLKRLPAWRWIRAGSPYILKVSAPAFATSLLWQTGYLVLLVLAATLPYGGIAALAGLTAGLRIEALLFLPASAFNMTASVLVGHALGEGNPAEARKLMLQILGTACCLMSLVGALMWPFRETLAVLLAPDVSVQKEIVGYLTYNILSVPFTVGGIVLGGVLSGAGATVYAMLAYAVAVWFVRLPVAWFLGHYYWQDSEGIYVAMLLSQATQALCLVWIALRCNWMRFAMHARRLRV